MKNGGGLQLGPLTTTFITIMYAVELDMHRVSHNSYLANSIQSLFWLITVPASCRRASEIANNEPLDHKDPCSNINP